MKEDFAEQCLHKDFPSIATLKQVLAFYCKTYMTWVPCVGRQVS